MELNREQIIKALECLVDNYSENGSYNTYVTLRDALALIKELTAENVRLRASSVDYRNIPYIVAEAQAATVREFADRLKNYYSHLNGRTPTCLAAYHIEQIAKEMIGE